MHVVYRATCQHVPSVCCRHCCNLFCLKVLIPCSIIFFNKIGVYSFFLHIFVSVNVIFTLLHSVFLCASHSNIQCDYNSSSDQYWDFAEWHNAWLVLVLLALLEHVRKLSELFVYRQSVSQDTPQHMHRWQSVLSM